MKSHFLQVHPHLVVHSKSSNINYFTSCLSLYACLIVTITSLASQVTSRNNVLECIIIICMSQDCLNKTTTILCQVICWEI